MMWTPVEARAQARAGSIVGVVSDASGGVLPGVSVVATSPSLTEQRTVVTDGSGHYAVVDLRPGTYTVVFTLQGFQTVRREGVILEGSFAAPVNAMLTIGALEESITVSSASPVVEVAMVYDRAANYMVRVEDDGRGFRLLKTGPVGCDPGGYYSHHWKAPPVIRKSGQVRLKGRTLVSSPESFRLHMQISVNGQPFESFGTIRWRRK